jgi:hypothetical protein
MRAPKAYETRYGRNTSMAADKKDYQSVLGALVDYGTLASIINKLNRVLIATEDTRGPRIIAVAGNRGHLWGEQHRIETRTKRNHSLVNSGCLTIGGNYSRSPLILRN